MRSQIGWSGLCLSMMEQEVVLSLSGIGSFDVASFAFAPLLLFYNLQSSGRLLDFSSALFARLLLFYLQSFLLA